jgi:hypothetical protein
MRSGKRVSASNNCELNGNEKKRWSGEDAIPPSCPPKNKIARKLFIYRRLALNFCGVGRDRTADTRIFSPLLYRLSYRTSFPFRGRREPNLDWGGKNRYFGQKIEIIRAKSLKIHGLAHRERLG